jgi:hypothetical protein
MSEQLVGHSAMHLRLTDFALGFPEVDRKNCGRKKFFRFQFVARLKMINQFEPGDEHGSDAPEKTKEQYDNDKYEWLQQ